MKNVFFLKRRLLSSCSRLFFFELQTWIDRLTTYTNKYLQIQNNQNENYKNDCLFYSRELISCSFFSTSLRVSSRRRHWPTWRRPPRPRWPRPWASARPPSPARRSCRCGPPIEPPRTTWPGSSRKNPARRNNSLPILRPQEDGRRQDAARHGIVEVPDKLYGRMRIEWRGYPKIVVARLEWHLAPLCLMTLGSADLADSLMNRPTWREGPRPGPELNRRSSGMFQPLRGGAGPLLSLPDCGQCACWRNPKARRRCREWRRCWGCQWCLTGRDGLPELSCFRDSTVNEKRNKH